VAIATNAFTGFDQIGKRESLANVIFNISPQDTPFMSNAGRTTVENPFYEWQTDSLAAAAGNSALDGDDSPSATAVVPTVRLGNYCQISRKIPMVTDRTGFIKTAGRANELAYQVAKMGAELKRDMEYVLIGGAAAVGGQIAVAGGTTTAPNTASLACFLKTNANKGAGGANPTYTTFPNGVRTVGTLRNFTETILKDLQKQCFVSGGKPTILMCGPVNKQRTSGFAGIAALTAFTTGTKEPSIIGAASVYVGDFGTVTVVPNRFQNEYEAFLLDPDYIDIAYLRPFEVKTLAKSGDAEKRLLIVDYGLKIGTEKAHGIAADLNIT